MLGEDIPSSGRPLSFLLCREFVSTGEGLLVLFLLLRDLWLEVLDGDREVEDIKATRSIAATRERGRAMGSFHQGTMGVCGGSVRHEENTRSAIPCFE